MAIVCQPSSISNLSSPILHVLSSSPSIAIESSAWLSRAHVDREWQTRRKSRASPFHRSLLSIHQAARSCSLFGSRTYPPACLDHPLRNIAKSSYIIHMSSDSRLPSRGSYSQLPPLRYTTDVALSRLSLSLSRRCRSKPIHRAPTTSIYFVKYLYRQDPYSIPPVMSP